jgi:hypothetical protein
VTGSAAPEPDRPPTLHGRAHGRLAPAAEFARLPRATDNYPLLGFREIYATIGVIGLRIGDRAKELAGQPVRIRGFMVTPLVDETDFFVLTRSPFMTCPFCDPDARWPDDVVLALLERGSRFVDPAQPIEVAGELEIGAKLEPRTGTVGLVRLRAARWQPVAP